MTIRIVLRSTLALPLALLAAAPVAPTAAAQVSAAAAVEPFRVDADITALGPGDSLRVTVWRQPELSGQFAIAPDGSVTHPLYRSVRVGGIPLTQARENLRRFLLRFDQEPQFVLEPLLRVAVVGEVNRPNLFALPVGTTVGQAVAQAGGPTSMGRLDRVKILRLAPDGQQSELRVDLLHPRSVPTGMPVRSGDQVVVERRKSVLRDVLLPALTVFGSLASIGIFIDRTTD
jgi:polysaccharide export outer membrane protein